ncbi:MAG TPA: type II toxin-antitoxin system prevent-host-death family antitoxin [Gemmatimonadales bacterium]|jgi:prevent-host-death family protein|nr:type II toxin-antitoxin system prevent-host-death family antitoxin [Gemmatimonadales bacterium]
MKEVRIAELKARLSEHLRYVRRGHVLTVLDRDTPVARLVPIEAPTGLAIRRPLGARTSVADVPLPPSLRLAVDPVAILLEDRRAEA